MAVTLDRLSSGHYCLNFDAGDSPAVRVALRELYNPPQPLDDYVVATAVVIGNAELTYYYEWDEQCLISSSLEGDAVLKAVVQHLDRAT